jgi:hypothetical protein
MLLEIGPNEWKTGLEEWSRCGWKGLVMSVRTIWLVSVGQPVCRWAVGPNVTPRRVAKTLVAAQAATSSEITPSGSQQLTTGAIKHHRNANVPNSESHAGEKVWAWLAKLKKWRSGKLKEKLDGGWNVSRRGARLRRFGCGSRAARPGGETKLEDKSGDTCTLPLHYPSLPSPPSPMLSHDAIPHHP